MVLGTKEKQMKLKLADGTAIMTTHQIRVGEKGAAVIPANTKGRVVHAQGDDAYYCEFFMDEGGVRKALATTFKTSIRPLSPKEMPDEKVLPMQSENPVSV
jgi:hypothetical protein